MTSTAAISAPHRLDHLQFAVIDVETSGLRPRRHRLLQVAVVVVDAEGAVVSRWSSYVRPRWWPIARLGPRHVHGITRGDLRDAPGEGEVIAELAARLQGTVVTAHNARFDMAFIERAARRRGVTLPDGTALCTLRMSRALDPERLSSHRLADLCVRYDVPPGRAHDALADATATAAVLPHLLRRLGVTSSDDLARYAP